MSLTLRSRHEWVIGSTDCTHQMRIVLLCRRVPHRAVGRTDDSLDAARAAWELDQEEQVLNSRLAIVHLWNNDMEEARQFYAIANAMEEGSPIHLFSYALFLIRDHRIEEAREVVRRAIALYRLDSSWVDPVFDGLAQLPDSAALIAALEEYSAPNALPDNTALVMMWVLAGKIDRAMEMAWKLVDDPNYFEIELIYLDEFQILRQHEDFPRLLDQLGLTDYWQSAGCRWENDEVTCNDT